MVLNYFKQKKKKKKAFLLKKVRCDVIANIVRLT